MNDTLQLSSIQFAFIGQIIAMGAVLWGLWKSVAAAGDKQAPMIESLRKEWLSKIDAEVSIADKQRHDMSNLLQTNMGRLKADVEQLKREAVRREDMISNEGRSTNQFVKIDAKIDLLNEKLVPLLALEKQVHSIDTRLAETLSRVDAHGAPIKRGEII